MKYIIGVDIGTSGTKAVALSHDGEILGNAYHAYDPVETEPDRHELDPDLLYTAFNAAVGDVLKLLKDKASVTAISFSSAMHSLVLIGSDNKPLTNLVTWADLRSRGQAQRLKASDEGMDIYRLSGTPIHPMTPLCKIMWFRENEPGLFAKTTKFISIKEYIIYKLTGKYLADYSIASATGLFDIYSLAWNTKALRVAGISVNQLSEAVTTTHTEKVVLFKDGELETSTTIVIGASDGCLANLGSNAVRPGDVALTIGTSGAVRMVSAAPKHDVKARIFNYVLTPGLFVSGGPINNGGVLLKWYTENFLEQRPGADISFDEFVTIAAKVDAGCDGLVFLPYIQGERAPIWNADARGVFFGITSQHTQAHFMRAIIEGICFALLDVSISLEETLGDIKNVFASGGFVKSPAWVQILSDILGKKIQITDTADASSIGAAMLGLFATSVVDSVEHTTGFLSVQKTYTPDLSNKNIYQKNFVTYRSLYIKLRDEF